MNAHTWTKLPAHANGWEVLLATSEDLWLRTKHPFYLSADPMGWVLRLDRRTLATRAACPIGGTRHLWNTFAVGQRWAAAMEGYAVVGFDPESGERRWKRNSKLIAASGDRIALKPMDFAGDRVELLDAVTGETLATTPSTARCSELGASTGLFDAEGLTYVGSSAIVRFDAESWQVTSRLELPQRDAMEALVRIDGRLLLLRTRERATGMVTEVSSVDLAGEELALIDEVEGGFAGCGSVGELLILWGGAGQYKTRCTGLIPGGPRASVVSADQSFIGLAVDGAVGVAAQAGSLECFRRRGSELTWARTPLPDFSNTCALLGDDVWVVANDMLLHLQLAAVWDGPVLELAHRPRDVPRARPDGFGRVIVPAETGATVEHHALGTVHLPGDSSALGTQQRVAIDDATEELPGLWQVHAWRSNAPDPLAWTAETGLLVLDPAQMLASVSTPPAAVRGYALEALMECARTRGFHVSPLMASLFELHDADELFRGWLERLGLSLMIEGTTGCWLGTDPSFVSFGGDESGNNYGIYLYPPQQKPGAEPPCVEWDHETRKVSWAGHDFSAFLARRLSYGNPEIRGFVVERLGLAPDFPRKEHEPDPEWFAAAHGRPVVNGTLADAQALAKDDPIAAERMMVVLHRLDERSDAIREALEALYAELGWEHHRRNLQISHEQSVEYR